MQKSEVLFSGKIKAVIFDMDGVLLDSEKLYTRFWKQAAIDCGYPMTMEHSLSIRSLNCKKTEEKLRSYFGEEFVLEPVYKRRVELMDKYIAENGIDTKNGAFEIVTELKQKGYKLALATSSPYERAEEQLGKFGIFELFDEYACGKIVANSKPAPDIYLLACKKLGLPPELCAAVEDSPNGLTAASAAGCIPVFIEDLPVKDEELAELDIVRMKSLFDLSALPEITD